MRQRQADVEQAARAETRRLPVRRDFDRRPREDPGSRRDQRGVGRHSDMCPVWQCGRTQLKTTYTYFLCIVLFSSKSI